MRWRGLLTEHLPLRSLRFRVLSRLGATVLSKMTEGLQDLAHWHSQATRLFPLPITIDGDDVHKVTFDLC